MSKKIKDSVIFDDKNFNVGTELGKQLIDKSILKFGYREASVLDKHGNIIGGNKRTKSAIDNGITEIEIIKAEKGKVYALQFDDIELDSQEGRELALALNATAKENIAFDEEIVFEVLGEEIAFDWGFEEIVKQEKAPGKSLMKQFIIPPFSILDTKQSAWQQRKNYWLSLGIKSENGRDTKCLQKNINKEDYGIKQMTAISIFDPVLCELAYKWFNVPNGKILDPFAGGSVRGIVAAKLGFEYLGNDLSEKQIIANRNNAIEVLQESDLSPNWSVGDSLNIDQIAKDYEADIIFSCPPYSDLEVYSDDERDISNMNYANFVVNYREIIRKSIVLLKEDRFAVFVVGDIRDKRGFYRNFISDTISAFCDCGMLLYNEMVLVNFVGTLAIRAARPFNASRKIAKQHQNVLVFYKGNPKNIKDNFPKIDLDYIKSETDMEEEE